MKLGVGDRLILLSILPREGDITTLKIVRELRENLSFDEAEHKELQLTSEGDTVRWNDKQIEKDIIPANRIALAGMINRLKRISQLVMSLKVLSAVLS